uniref:G-protein coupled receptors family 1 profile domain-containing protein n=1 Tax=Gopherus agassizii TaxID=38772 RepID=A0A452GL44_9SAUR
ISFSLLLNISYYLFEYDQITPPCDKGEVRNFTKVFLPIAYSIICILGLVGNIFVVMTFALYKKPKSMTDIYLFNMAIADILFVLTLPFWAVNYAAEKWIFGDFICKITRGIYAINFNCGMLLLAFISMDRYISFKLRARTLAYSRLICLVVWVLSILISSSTFIFSQSYSHSINETEQICEHSAFFLCTGSKLFLLGMQLLFGFFIPLLFMVFCSAFIVKSLVKAQNSKRNKAICLLVLIVAVFLVCQVPYNMVLLVTAINMGKLNKLCDSEKQIAFAKYITEVLAFFHCCLNPVLYAFIGVKFRSYFLNMMNDLCFDTNHSRQTSEIMSDNVSSFTM